MKKLKHMHKKIKLQELKDKLSERNIQTSDFMPLVNYLSKQEYILVECLRVNYVNNKKDIFRIPYTLLDSVLVIHPSQRNRLVRTLIEKRIIYKLEDKQYKWDIQGLDQYLCVQEDSTRVKQEKYIQKQNKPAPVRVQEEEQDWYYDEYGIMCDKKTGKAII